MNTPLEAQEVITRTGNYFVTLQKQYEEKTFKILKDLTEVTAYLKSL